MTASAASFAQRSLLSPELGKAASALPGRTGELWPPAHWDRATLLTVAVLQNPELSVLRSEVAVTQARQLRARQLPNPELTLQSEYSRGEQYTWLYGLGLDFALVPPRQRRLNIRIAERGTATSRLQMVEKTWQVRRQLISGLSDWQLARKRLPLLQELIAAQQRLSEIQQRRIAAGEDSPSEAAASEVAVLQAQRGLAEARVAASRAQSEVAAVLGVPPVALNDLEVSWEDWGDPPVLTEEQLPVLREQALLGRSDLAAAINEYADSEDQLQLAVARQYPQLHLAPGYYWDHGVGKWPLNLGLALPVFNRNQGEIAEARAGRELAGQRMLSVQAQIYGEIAAAYQADGLGAAAVSRSSAQQQLTRTQSQQAQLGLEAGAIDSSQRLGAKIVSLQAQLDELDTRALRQAARNDLEDALHSPLSGPETSLGRGVSP